MVERDDDYMAKPVTRGELRVELAVVRKEMAMWGNALNDRIERGERLLMKHMAEQERRLMTEVGRCTTAILEAVRGQISALDDKYKDLPGRVVRLERGRKLKG